MVDRKEYGHICLSFCLLEVNRHACKLMSVTRRPASILTWKPDWMLEVIVNKLFENIEALVELKETYMWRLGCP